jgi:hypothetical protein
MDVDDVRQDRTGEALPDGPRPAELIAAGALVTTNYDTGGRGDIVIWLELTDEP